MKKLENIIKKLEGKVVCFGIDSEKIIDLIDLNDKIYDCDLLNCDYGDEEGKATVTHIKKLRKRYKKNKADYMIIKASNIDSYKLKIVADSVFITKNKVIIYDEEANLDSLIEKYKRYDVNIEDNNKFALIDVSNAKNNKIKDKLYCLKDILDIISDKIEEVIN